MADSICTVCKTVFTPKPKTRAAMAWIIPGVLVIALGGIAAAQGGGGLAMLVVIIGALPVIVGRRLLRPSTTCPTCSSTATIPTDSPKGRELV